MLCYFYRLWLVYRLFYWTTDRDLFVLVYIYKPKSNIGMSQKQVMPKSEDLSRSIEINAIWTFDTEFPTIFIKSRTYITLKSAVNVIE